MIRNLFLRFKKERDLTTIPISKGIWILAIPMIISNLLQAAYNLVDMVWVGRLGAEALAAVSMSGQILMITIFIMIGVGIGTTALVARSFGAKQTDEANKIALQSLIMGFFGAVIFGVIGYYFSPAMLKALGASPEVLQLGVGYMQVLFAGIIVMFCLFFVAAILQGAGDAATPMVILGFSVVLNVILDPLLIFGIGIFPRLGVVGAAWATVIAEAIGSIIALEILLRGRSRIHVRLSNFKVDFGVMWRILKIGIPASMQMILRGMMGIVLIVIVAGFGTVAIAAYGVGMRLTMLAMMPGFALGAAAGTMVGQNLGAQKPDRAVASAWTAVGIYFVFMAVISSTFFFLAPQLMQIFNNQPEVISIGSQFLRIVSLGMLFVSVGLILGRAVSGAGDTMHPMLFTFIALWLVQIPLAFVLARFTPLGLTGVWVAILAAQIVLVSLNTIWFQMGRWKLKKI
ncbi:MATE family efflux transporter [Candidatus Margulisiibacteriota bacterium]